MHTAPISWRRGSVPPFNHAVSRMIVCAAVRKWSSFWALLVAPASPVPRMPNVDRVDVSINNAALRTWNPNAEPMPPGGNNICFHGECHIRVTRIQALSPFPHYPVKTRIMQIRAGLPLVVLVVATRIQHQRWWVHVKQREGKKE